MYRYKFIIVLIVYMLLVSFSFSKTSSETVYIDSAVKEGDRFLTLGESSNTGTYHLITHGRPGHLLINGQWMNASQIASFLTPRLILNSEFKIQNLNIYGCEFAKGEKGKKAVKYLEEKLDVKVAASDDITGKNGDWELEVGFFKKFDEFKTYAYNLQCADNDNTQTIGPNTMNFDSSTYLHNAGTISTPIPDFNFTVTRVGSQNGIYWGTGPRLTVYSQGNTERGGDIIFNKPLEKFYLYIGNLVNLSSTNEQARLIAYDVDGNPVRYTTYTIHSGYSGTNVNVSGTNSATTLINADEGETARVTFYFGKPIKKIRLTSWNTESNSKGEPSDGVVEIALYGGCVNSICTSNNAAPTTEASNYITPCDGSSTFNLNSIEVSGCSSGTEVQWHTTDTNIYSATLVNNPEAVPEGTYYAVCYDSVNGCYSNVSGPVSIKKCIDFDHDLVDDSIDLDDDNDGILDAVESPECFYSKYALLTNKSEFVNVSTDLQPYTTNGNVQEVIDGYHDQYGGFVAENNIPITNKAIYTFEMEGPVELKDIYMVYFDGYTHLSSGSVVLQGSFNGSTWVDLNEPRTNMNATVMPVVDLDPDFKKSAQRFTVAQNSDKYKYYRIFASSGTTTYGGRALEVFFAPKDELTPSAYPKACSATGIPNHQNLDSDGDGCPDAKEAGVVDNATDVTFGDDGEIGTGSFVDVNNNGFDDRLERSTTDSNYKYDYTYYLANDSSVNACTDTDGDEVADIIDIDDDNDGILDTEEGHVCTSYYMEGAATCERIKDENGNTNYRWTDWDSTVENVTTGTITLANGEVVDVTLTMSNPPVNDWGIVRTSENGNFNTQSEYCPYNGQNGISMADSYAYNNGEGVFVTVEFSKPVINPILDVWSAGNSGLTVTYTFPNNELALLSGNSGISVSEDGHQLISTEGDGSVMLLGPVEKFTYYSNQRETWTNIQLLAGTVIESGKISDFSVLSCEDLDTDGDGIPNHLDLDSDGDGCPDAVEAGTAKQAGDGNTSPGDLENKPEHGGMQFGIADTRVGSDTPSDYGENGLYNGIESNDTQKSEYEGDYSYSYAISRNVNFCEDADIDDIPDFIDIDDDNDGILDENEYCTGTPSVYVYAWHQLSQTGSETQPVYTTGTSTTTPNRSEVDSYFYGIGDGVRRPSNESLELVEGEYFVNGLINSSNYFQNDEIDFQNPKQGSYPNTGGYYIIEFLLKIPENAASISLRTKTNFISRHALFVAHDGAASPTPSVYKNDVRAVGSGNGSSFSPEINFTGAEGKLVRVALTTNDGNANTAVTLQWNINGSGFVNVPFSAARSCDLQTDTDNDGIPNHLDLDSDGDGCPDIKEAGVVDYLKSIGEESMLASGEVTNGNGVDESENTISTVDGAKMETTNNGDTVGPNNGFHDTLEQTNAGIYDNTPYNTTPYLDFEDKSVCRLRKIYSNPSMHSYRKPKQD